MKRFGIIAGLAMGLAVVWGGIHAGCAVGESPSGRQQAPDFKLTDLDGNPLSLSSQKGRVVLLDFWATWCPPCREELPHFKALYATYKGQGFEIIGIALDQGGEAMVKPFVQKEGVSYPIAMGNSKITQAYGGIRGIPTTFLIDKKGGIAKKYVGYQDKSVFEGEIQKLLVE